MAKRKTYRILVNPKYSSWGLNIYKGVDSSSVPNKHRHPNLYHPQWYKTKEQKRIK